MILNGTSVTVWGHDAFETIGGEVVTSFRFSTLTRRPSSAISTALATIDARPERARAEKAIAIVQ